MKDTLQKIIQLEPEEDAEDIDSSVAQGGISGESDMHIKYSEVRNFGSLYNIVVNVLMNSLGHFINVRLLAR